MLRPASAALTLGFIGLTVLTLHCGSDGDGSAFDDGSGNRDGGADGSGNFGPGFGNGNGTGGGTGGGGGAGGDGGGEVCDGIDNDGDGRIDNIDRGNDGICDCLLIATLGVKGGAGGSSDVFKTWLNGKSDIGAADLGDAILTPELLAKYQVIVAQNLKGNHEYKQPEIDALKAWVDKGGGFLTLIGYADATEVINVNRLLAPLGTKYNNVPILGKSGSASTIPIETWTPNQPVTDGITKIGVDNGYEVQGTGATQAPILAQYKKDSTVFTLLRGQPVGSGHVLTWGDEWITFDGEWKDHPDYQTERFWLNMIKWLTPAAQCQVPIPPGIK